MGNKGKVGYRSDVSDEERWFVALHVTSANEHDRPHVEQLAEEVQRITGDHIELGYVDQGYRETPLRAPRPGTASNWKW